MSRGLLWTWRRQVQTGTLAPAAPSVFVPVRIAPEVNLGAPVALPHGGIADADGSVSIGAQKGPPIGVQKGPRVSGGLGALLFGPEP